LAKIIVVYKDEAVLPVIVPAVRPTTMVTENVARPDGIGTKKIDVLADFNNLHADLRVG